MDHHGAGHTATTYFYSASALSPSMLSLGLISRALGGFTVCLLTESSLKNQHSSSGATTTSGERVPGALLLGRAGVSPCPKAEASHRHVLFWQCEPPEGRVM